MSDKNKPAAIRADFADFRQVKSRKVAQLIFEVPLEQLPEVMEVLGWPRPDGNIPVGIARLVAEIGPDRPSQGLGTPSASGEGQDIRRTYSRSQMAAILCSDFDFQEWFWITILHMDEKSFFSSEPAMTAELKKHLNINSRSELDTDPSKGEAWDKLYNSFKYREMAR